MSRLPAGSGLPGWAAGNGIVPVTQAPQEISVLCLAERVPQGVESSSGWCALEVSNLCDLDEPGVVLAAVRPVSEAGFGVFVTSTYLRDYLLVRQADSGPVVAGWRAAGHEVQPLA